MGDAKRRGTFEERKNLAQEELKPSARRRLNAALLVQRKNIVKRRSELKSAFYRPQDKDDPRNPRTPWEWNNPEARTLYNELSSMLVDYNEQLRKGSQ